MGRSSSPPETLVGRKLITIRNCYYASEAYLAENHPDCSASSARWIGRDDFERFPAWVKASPFPHLRDAARLRKFRAFVAESIERKRSRLLGEPVPEHG